MKAEHRETAVLALLVLLAAGLRLWGLGDWPFEQDELYTLRDARAIPDSVNPMRPAYYVMQHLLLAVVPPTAIGLRLLPFVFGVAGVWLTWLLARRVHGAAAAPVAAFLVAIAPWHLYTSQFARYWSLIYLLAGAAYLFLYRAAEIDRPRAYLAAAGTIVLGVLTHPTFAFPMVGVAASLWFVGPDGRIAWRVPGRRAWLWLWGPLVLAGIVWLAVTQSAGSAGRALDGGRGWRSTLLVVPAVVQWADPAIIAAAGVGALAMLVLGRGGDRRWGLTAVMGGTSTFTILLVIGRRADVYADYAMAMLPLVFVTVGGAVQRVADRLGSAGPAFAGAAALVLGGAVAPGTVSHLMDGSRFDFRPAFAYIERAGPERSVLGWPRVLQEYYAPRLRFRPLRPDERYLDETLTTEPGFWVTARYDRRGLVADDGTAKRWLARHCRVLLVTERLRLDYRVYRVELRWCGDGPAPDGA